MIAVYDIPMATFFGQCSRYGRIHSKITASWNTAIKQEEDLPLPLPLPVALFPLLFPLPAPVLPFPEQHIHTHLQKHNVSSDCELLVKQICC